MKLNRKVMIILVIVLAAVTLTSCKIKNYAGFDVTQSKAITGDYIILPDINMDTYNIDEIVIKQEKTYHVPLAFYKAAEKKLTDFAVKFNDFSTGLTYNEARDLYDLFFQDYGASLITDGKEKSAYYAVITDLMTKSEAKNAEAIAFTNEFDSFISDFSDVLDYGIEMLEGVYDFANKEDRWTEKHEDLFEGGDCFSKVMSIWFPSVKFISSFAEKTGPEIANPWIPDWEDLLAKVKDLNTNYKEALTQVDLDDPDAIDAIIDENDDAYYDLRSIWYDLPDLEEYSQQYEALSDEYDTIYDEAYDLYSDAYDAYWDSYWDYYWW